MVEPGVLVYHIKEDEDAAAQRPPTTGGVRKTRADEDSPWYSQLWTSLRLADQPADTLPVDAPVLRGEPVPSIPPLAPAPAPSPSKK
jgi:hypothetical protein